MFSTVGVILLLVGFIPSTTSLKYDPEQVPWNLNQNQTATHPIDYWGERDNHTYTPSPDNWRFPFYTLMLDRFVNGDPTNDDANGTAWEHDLYGTQLRHGGDVKGLQDTLDYLVSMGIKGIYLAGSPMINFPWASDAFSPLDLTLLDAHFATIDVWRECIDEMHARGMYVIFDNTMATLGDLIGFEGFLNVSTPIVVGEHNALYKTSRHYHDFTFNNEELEVCDVEYPRWWNDYGEQVHDNGTQNLRGCRNSEFDQYGDMPAFEKLPYGGEWQRQISKFASVQDRLREWKPSVREKIQHLSCIQIAMLDIDGFRMDKGQQITVDAQGEFADYIRSCARAHGKNNFFIPGEIVSGNAFGAIYLGRGKAPAQSVNDTTKAIQLTTNTSDPSLYIRDVGKNAFDAACFHYSTYRALTRFLGMDGDLGANGETPVDFVDAWNDFIRTNDLINPNTGVFDPRHMYGAQNQDVFRWPSIEQGTLKQNLANFITTLLLPGIPMLEWGEEQAYYLMDNTANNYVFGRQSMTASTAWQDHGCYSVGNAKFATWPPGTYSIGCQDDWNSLDHRDPSHPIKNIITSQFEMRQRYPVLNDGFWVETLSKQTHNIFLPGSMGTATETGIWSVRRAGFPDVKILGQNTFKTQNVWMLYHNEGTDVNYVFECKSNSTGLLAPFNEGTTVKNLLYPYDQVTLSSTPQKLKLDNETSVNGCLSNMSLTAFGYKAYVPIEEWLRPSPVITYFAPGHDARILANTSSDEQQTIPFELHFSDEMDCQKVQDAITFTSTVENAKTPSLDANTIKCTKTNDTMVYVSKNTGPITGVIPSEWRITGNIVNVSHGIHTLTLANVSTWAGNTSTNSVNHFLFRLGLKENPMVFPRSGNYSNSLLYERSDGSMYINHKAAGADKYRYSLNWGSNWSDWLSYSGGNTTVDKKQPWSGTKAQEWSGQHVMVQYWSQKAGSSNSITQGDLVDTNAATTPIPRRWPHVFLHGAWNEYGYDSGVPEQMTQDSAGIWNYDFMIEWPGQIQFNVWGSNPDGQPDLTKAFGDVDLDGVLDFLSPVSLLQNVVNVTAFPEHPFLAYHVKVNDADMRYSLTPMGSRSRQIALVFLLAFIPLVLALIGRWLYQHTFYDVKHNEMGRAEKGPVMAMVSKTKHRLYESIPAAALMPLNKLRPAPAGAIVSAKKKTVLIATMEYDIDDWGIKIKIGGLGVIAQLMSKYLEDSMDLIWVIPCVEGIDYPIDQRAKPMTVIIMGEPYVIHVQYHHLRNITFVVLDAPVFRKNTKADPYPARMDDMESAVFYSAWNQCIAECMRRFPIDLYHINDYHGAVAPLHLLPRVIPCCLSLHNAEFQGLWAMRTPQEHSEICSIYNLAPEIVRQYVQFGEVFNLLHAGATYLKTWQKGYGAVGVSGKYGKRVFQRYPILWGLNHVGSLPNPDPADSGDWSKEYPDTKEVTPDQALEANRGALRMEAQEWAGLNVDPEAELFVFVGRWSMQKGVDLIADVFPSILESNSKTQLICIGPVIDLYGKFAALKLDRLMKMYPDRVYSKPVFTALPECIFSGAEFVLIASRDEPFGLVAVEFGRKGALGVGSRVGGLGNMPGWWYTVESNVSKHLINQFKQAIHAALASKPSVRAQMRARAAKQRFPVVQWVEDLNTMQDNSIKINQRQVMKHALRSGTTTPAEMRHPGEPESGIMTSGTMTPRFSRGWWGAQTGMSTNATVSAAPSGRSTRAPSPTGSVNGTPGRNILYSLGTRYGPGHQSDPDREGRQRKRLSKSKPGSRESSIGAQLKRLGRSRNGSRNGSRNNSRNSSPVRSSSFTNLSAAAQPEPPVPPIPKAVLQNKRISRIQEILDEDKPASGSKPQGDIAQFDFAEDNSRESSARNGNSTEGSDRQRDGSDRDHDDDDLDENIGDELLLTHEQVESAREARRIARLRLSLGVHFKDQSLPGRPFPASQMSTAPNSRTPSPPDTPMAEEHLLSEEHRLGQREANEEPETAYLSLGGVLNGKKDYKLQAVEPFFTDPTGLYHAAFDKKLEKLNAKNSEGPLCIEEYLMSSEKDWFSRFRNVKLGKSAATTPASSVFRSARYNGHSNTSSSDETLNDFAVDNDIEQYGIQDHYQPPTGLRKLLMIRIRDWPIYSFLLAFGQIIAANSYQITLLTGEVGQAAEKLYIIATIYLVSSLCWWWLFRTCKSVWVLAPPFFFYGMAFFLLGVAPYASSIAGRGWIQNVATACYAIASSSGAFFFSLNFGSEGSVPVATWSFRACVIQGSQQIYVVVLWYWGAKLTDIAVSGQVASKLVAYGPGLTAITTPIAIILWGIGVIIYLGLPDYYRQAPGQIPSFYRAVNKRRIVIWFFVTVLLQNFFLSADYGRNWRYLFASQHLPAGILFALVVLFFVIVWAVSLAFFYRESRTHTWILPIFAISLGAPRWCQMLWSTSGMGTWVPWAGGPLASAIVGRSLWLWLGVLDQLQGVGLGMILLQTLTRFHVTYVLVGSQVLGSIATIVARACAPDSNGPGDVFPNLVLGLGGLGKAWFWIALICNLLIPVGFAKWFRREQLMKP